MKKLNDLKIDCNNNWGFEVWDIANSIISRIDYDEVHDDEELQEAIFQALDDELIYYSQQWAILKEYCIPQEADWNEAIEAFIDDLFASIEADWIDEEDEDEDGEA